MMASNRYRLRHLAQSGNRGAEKSLALLDQTDKMLGVILLGNNLVNAAAATLVSVIAIKLFGEEKWALAAGTLIVTFAILVFSEITPKIVGATYADRIALVLTHILAPLLRLFYPLVWFINLFASGLGLLTVEDIVEEFVGEFTTSVPGPGRSLAWDDQGSAIVEGSRHLRDINRLLGLQFPLAGPKTLNGLILEHFQDIPDAGVSIRLTGVAIEILKTGERDVVTVRMFRPARRWACLVQSLQTGVSVASSPNLNGI